jgi:mycothiol synthase
MAESIVSPLILPSVPRLPGLRLRPPAGPSDYGPMSEVYTAAALADRLEEAVSEADIAAFMENPVDRDPTLDTLIAEVDGRVVGYGWVNHRLEAAHSAERPEGDRASHPGGDSAERLEGDSAERPEGDEVHVHRGYVHPAWRRRGLGGTLLRHAWRRAQGRRLSLDPATPRLLQTFTFESETGGHALAQRSGYRPIRYSFMMTRDLEAPIPPFDLPDGIEVRPARPEHRRLIWEAEREAFQDHWGYAPWPEQAYQRFLDFPHYDLRLWQVAWQGDQVVGSVLNYINKVENLESMRRRGYTEDISVRQPWRHRGVATALIARSLETLRARGMAEAVLGVDAENRTGALRVYERLGYTVFKQWTVYRRPLPIAGEEGDTS